MSCLVIGAIVAAGCERSEDYRRLTDDTCTAGEGDIGGEVHAVHRKHWREMNRNDPPLRPRHIRKADLGRYPRSDFAILLEDDRGGRLDTRAGTATIDMIADPDTTITLELTTTELDTIYAAAIAMRIFDYPEPHPVLETTGDSMCPSFAYHLHVEAGGQVRDLRWSTFYNPGGKTLDDWRRLYDLLYLIQRTVYARPEVRALPPRRGGYD